MLPYVLDLFRQCPEECRETVASLMFAAARFSDLPELRDLRDVFQERYGNGLECFVNQVVGLSLSYENEYLYHPCSSYHSNQFLEFC